MEDGFWGADGDAEGPVPVVLHEDIKAAWITCSDLDARFADRPVGIGIEVFQRACSPGANIAAVVYRTWMLQFMEEFGLLNRWLHNGELDEAVFRVAATFPLTKMQAGVVHEGFPFDVETFMEQVEEEANS